MILESQSGEFADSGGGIVEQDQQHPTMPRFSRLAGKCSKGGAGLSFAQIFHGRLWRDLWSKTFGCLS